MYLNIFSTIWHVKNLLTQSTMPIKILKLTMKLDKITPNDYIKKNKVKIPKFKNEN